MYFIKYKQLDNKDKRKNNFDNDLYSIILYIKKGNEIVFINLVLTIDDNLKQWIIVDKLEFFTILNNDKLDKSQNIVDADGMDIFYKQVAGMKAYYEIPDNNIIVHPINYLELDYLFNLKEILDIKSHSVFIYPINILSIFFLEFSELKKRINELNIVVGKVGNQIQLNFLNGNISEQNIIYTMQKHDNNIISFGQIINFNSINGIVDYISIAEIDKKKMTIDSYNYIINSVLGISKKQGYIVDYMGNKKEISLKNLSEYYKEFIK